MKLHTVILVGLVLASPFAFGWGQYGHEQVNSAAIDLLDTNTSIGKCFRDARKTIVRYAITPDIEWKTDLQVKTLSSQSSQQRRKNDCYEHPLHFFEADSFIQQNGGAISKLPTDNDYSTRAFPAYVQLLSMLVNRTYVVTVDPTKKLQNPSNPTPMDVVIHGTAPWRAESLYILAVDAMKKKDFRLAAFYLATMGHYIGDMSQPFHATLNFDGDYKPVDDYAGIHHEIDTGLFERLAERITKDSNDVFNSFDPTIKQVSQIATQEFAKYPSRLSSADIVPNVMKIVASGYPLVQGLLAAYKKQCDIANGKATKNRGKARKIAQQSVKLKDRTERNGEHGHVPIFPTDDQASDPSIQGHAYCEAIPDGQRGEVKAIGTEKEDQMNVAKIGDDMVATILETRLGLSSALLAKLWISAFQEAGQPAFGDCSGWSFDEDYAIMNYPIPNYYPANFDGVTKAGCAHQP